MNKAMITALILTLAIPLGSAFAAERSVKIFDGVPADPGEFPEYIAINDSNTLYGHRCGGTLISPHWVLTAAHCVDEIVKSAQTILVGLEVYSPLKLKDQVGIVEAIKHPSYNPYAIDINGKYDIGLVKLARAANSTDFSLLDGFNTETDPPADLTDYTLTAAGFGGINPHGDYKPNVLYKVDEHVLPDQDCITVPVEYPPSNFDPAMHICAGQGTGGGDSGGPLVITYNGKRYQVGIVARGLVFPAEQFTRVKYFAQWIKETAVE